MKVNFYNGLHDWDDCNHKIALNWFYYNSTPEKSAKGNKYRARLGFPIILDDGCYFQIVLVVGRRSFEIRITFRDRVLGPKPAPPQAS